MNFDLDFTLTRMADGRAILRRKHGDQYNMLAQPYSELLSLQLRAGAVDLLGAVKTALVTASPDDRIWLIAAAADLVDSGEVALDTDTLGSTTPRKGGLVLTLGVSLLAIAAAYVAWLVLG